MRLNADRRLCDGFELAHVDPLLPAVTKVPAACHRAVIEAKSCGRKGGAVGAACTRADQSRQGPISPTSPILRTRTAPSRSEEHTSELQSLMRISYAVFCLTKKIQIQDLQPHFC